MKTVVCGVGNRMRGDDAAGPMVIDELATRVKNKTVLLIDCESLPENFIKQITKFNPDKIIMVHTAHFNGKAGEFREIDPESIKKQSISTHKMPLTMLIDYLRSRISFDLVFIGIQPKHAGLDTQISDECKRAVKNVSYLISKTLEE